MASFLHTLRSTLAAWLRPKTIPSSLTGGQWSGTSFVDAFKRNREPTPNELMAELKNTAFTCATINAAVCAAYPPRLYVATQASTAPAPRCLTRALTKAEDNRLRSLAHLPAR